jgi:hypothetical protein
MEDVLPAISYPEDTEIIPYETAQEKELSSIPSIEETIEGDIVPVEASLSLGETPEEPVMEESDFSENTTDFANGEEISASLSDEERSGSVSEAISTEEQPSEPSESAQEHQINEQTTDVAETVMTQQSVSHQIQSIAAEVQQDAAEALKAAQQAQYSELSAQNAAQAARQYRSDILNALGISPSFLQRKSGFLS